MRTLGEKIRRYERTIDNLQTSSSASKDLEFIHTQVEKYEGAIKAAQKALVDLEVKANNVHTGASDPEIKALLKSNSDQAKDEADKKAKKEAADYKKELELQARGQAGMSRERNDMRNEAYTKRSMEKEYAKFLDVSDTLPDYIRKNLETMPNNKAYRFRGILFFGKLPEEPGAPFIIFDKRQEGTFISETTPTSYVEYTKTHHGPKVVKVQRRRRLNFRAPATEW